MDEWMDIFLKHKPWITVSFRLPAVAQFYHVLGWYLVGHQVIIRGVLVVVSTHTTKLKRERKVKKHYTVRCFVFEGKAVFNVSTLLKYSPGTVISR